MDRDLLKTQSESHPGNPQSKRQKTKIIRQAHQQTVLRSLQVSDSLLLSRLPRRNHHVLVMSPEPNDGMRLAI